MPYFGTRQSFLSPVIPGNLCFYCLHKCGDLCLLPVDVMGLLERLFFDKYAASKNSLLSSVAI